MASKPRLLCWFLLLTTNPFLQTILQKSYQISQGSNSLFPSASAATLLRPNLVGGDSSSTLSNCPQPDLMNKFVQWNLSDSSASQVRSPLRRLRGPKSLWRVATVVLRPFPANTRMLEGTDRFGMHPQK